MQQCATNVYVLSLLGGSVCSVHLQNSRQLRFVRTGIRNKPLLEWRWMIGWGHLWGQSCTFWVLLIITLQQDQVNWWEIELFWTAVGDRCVEAGANCMDGGLLGWQWRWLRECDEVSKPFMYSPIWHWYTQQQKQEPLSQNWHYRGGIHESRILVGYDATISD